MHLARRPRTLLRRPGPRAATAFAVIAAAAGGCGGPYVPAAGLEPTLEAARTEDRDAIPDLIESLASSDPAVRLSAIETLERLTGETMGYRHYDSMIDRNAAIEDWIAAYQRGDFEGTEASD